MGFESSRCVGGLSTLISLPHHVIICVSPFASFKQMPLNALVFESSSVWEGFLH
jgi:hypothetical protein